MKMSDVDLLIESTINEAPVGMLKRGALKVASKLGSQKAAGQEVTANIANQLKKEYSRYLGVTGYEPDKESIEAFLNSKGLSSDSLDTAISSVSDTGPTGQDWRIDTGPRTGATNQRVEPVVDIGSATDEVPALDGESPIEQARAKRIAAQQKAVQQLRGQQPEPTDTVKSTGGASSLQQIRSKIAAANPNRLAGMGAGYVPPTEPTSQEPEVAQPVPSATGTQAASALGRLKTPQNSMKGRTSLVSKIKGQQASPEVPAQEPATRERPGISTRAGKAGVSQPKVPQFTSASAMSKATAEKKAELDTKLQAIDDAKAALANSPKSGKLKDALKQAEADYDAFVSSEIKPADLKDKLATKVDQIKSGEPEPTSTNSPVSKPQSKYGKGIHGVHRAYQDQERKRDAAMPAYNAAANDYLNAVKTAKTQDEKDAATATFDEFRNKFIKDFGWGTDPMINDLLIPYPTIQSTTKPSTTQSGQMELPTEEPVAAPDVEKVQSAVDKAQAEYDKVNKAGISKSTKDKKLKALNAAKVELAKATGTEPEVVPAPEPVSMQSPVTAVKPEKPAAVKAEPKSEPADKIGKLTAKAQELATEFKKDPTNKALGKQAMDAITALKAAKEAEVEPEDSDYTPTGMSSEFSRFAKAMPSASKKSSSEEEPTPAADDEDAWMDQEPMPKAKKEKAAKNKKMALAASVEHEFDYLLAEAALTNKQVDKIILAVTQDNIRKGIISIPGVPQGAQARTQQAQRQPQRPTAQPAAASMGGSPQYTQPREQPVGGKSLDLSDFNVDRLIGAINHLMKKEELQRYEERQLKKLLDELKALR